MRIACIAGRFPLWSEQFIQRDCLALADKGHEIFVWPAESSPGLLRWTAPDGMPQPPLLSDHPSSLGAAASTLCTCGTWQLRRLPHVLRMRDLLPWMPDIVWAAFGSLPAVLGASLAATLGKPLVVSMHARDVWVPWPPGLRALSFAQRIAVCNNTACEQIKRIAPVPGDRFELIHHSLPDTSTAPQLSATAETKSPAILAAGRLVPKKGFDILIRAMAEVCRSIPEARLTIVGEGPEDATYREIRRQVNLSKEQVELKARQSSLALREMMCAATTVAVPSRIDEDGDRDGIPNVMLEAMLAGTPVVGTDAGGIPEVLDSERGLLVPPDDPAALAEAITETVRNRQEALARAQCAREYVQSAFSAANTTDRLASLLESVAQKDPA